MNKLKILCILIFIGLATAALTHNRHFVPVADASAGGPPAGSTGAPGETTCTNCHAQNSGVGQLTILAPQNYTPGQTYQITVRHQTSDTTRRRWGFQLTALANNSAAGSFANTVSNTQIIGGFADRSYIEHTLFGTFQNQANTAFWSFNWIAPATNVGTVTLYAAGNQANNDGTPDGDQIYTTSAAIQPPAVVPRRARADFDGDGKSDVGVYRPPTGNWFINRSTDGFFASQFGISTDRIVPADYDGDNKSDLAVWRENGASQAVFYILSSSSNTFQGIGFGATGDLPAVGDWDGDGKADPAVYRGGAQGAFYYLGSVSGSLSAIVWGVPGDLPVRGDFDGDGRSDAAVFRPSDGIWYALQSSNGALFAVQWGISGDKLAPADFDGDGRTDAAVFRAGVWYIRESSTGGLLAFNWGIASDVPAPADFDGDGKTDVAVYRDGNWFIRQSADGNLNAQVFGIASDVPVPNSFVQ